MCHNYEMQNSRLVFSLIEIFSHKDLNQFALALLVCFFHISAQINAQSPELKHSISTL